MTIPKMFQLLKADPTFIRDNQYNNKYVVVCEDYDKEDFNHLENLYPLSVCEFPSGKRCFFLLDCTRLSYKGIK